MTRRIPKSVLLTITITAFLVVGWIGVHGLFIAPTEPELALAAANISPAINTGDGIIPTRIAIPTINVDANVQHVGIAKSGRIAVPLNYSDAAWYRYGPKPGNLGSAIILGHIDNGFALPAVFKRLSELLPGDEIIVTNKEGARHTFIVTDKRTVSGDMKLDKIVSGKEKEIILITCSGTWLKDKKMYTDRLIVTARAVAPER